MKRFGVFLRLEFPQTFLTPYPELPHCILQPLMVPVRFFVLCKNTAISIFSPKIEKGVAHLISLTFTGMTPPWHDF